MADGGMPTSSTSSVVELHQAPRLRRAQRREARGVAFRGGWRETERAVGHQQSASRACSGLRPGALKPEDEARQNRQVASSSAVRVRMRIAAHGAGGDGGGGGGGGDYTQPQPRQSSILNPQSAARSETNTKNQMPNGGLLATSY